MGLLPPQRIPQALLPPPKTCRCKTASDPAAPACTTHVLGCRACTGHHSSWLLEGTSHPAPAYPLPTSQPRIGSSHRECSGRRWATTNCLLRSTSTSLVTRKFLILAYQLLESNTISSPKSPFFYVNSTTSQTKLYATNQFLPPATTP